MKWESWFYLCSILLSLSAICRTDDSSPLWSMFTILLLMCTEFILRFHYLQLWMFEIAEIFSLQKQGKSIATENEDEGKDDNFSQWRKSSVDWSPNRLERLCLLLLVRNIKDGLALDSLGGPDVLVVEQAGGHVVVQVGGAGVPSNWHCVSYNILTNPDQMFTWYSNTIPKHWLFKFDQ